MSGIVADDPVPRVQVGARWGLAFACVWVLAVAWVVRDFYVDDAYIGFTYARDLLHGDGLTFYPATPPVEGVTNVGWVLVLAAVGLVAPLTAAAKVLGLALALVTVWSTWSVSLRVVDAVWVVQLAPVLLLVSSTEYLYFSLAGMETALLSALLMGMVLLAARAPTSPWLVALGAAAFLVRPDSVPVLLVYVVVLIVGDPALRRPAARLLLGLTGSLAVVTAARLIYFGAALPNTVVAKAPAWRTPLDNVMASLRPDSSVLPQPLTLPVVLVAAYGAVVLLRQRRAAGLMLVSVAGTGLAFSLYAPSDWTGLARYLAPYLPAFYVLLCVGLVRIARSVLGHGRGTRAATPAVLVVLAVVVLAQGTLLLARMSASSVADYPGYVLTSRTLVPAAVWMRQHLPPGTVIATRRIGALAFYSGLPVFDDTFGLTDPAVARLARRSGGAVPSPDDPSLRTRWDEVNPSCLLEDAPIMLGIAQRSTGDLRSFTVQGRTYGEVRRFPVGAGVAWVLACRTG